MAWEILEGAELKRRAVHDRYGGNRQTGITTTSVEPSSVFLFDTGGGAAYGYDFDGLQDDGTYNYTGEGQVGDQVFNPRNAAIRDHRADGRVLRLFRETRPTYVEYLGQWGVVPESPFSIEEGLDKKGVLRQLIVFRLRPAGRAPSFDVINRTTVVIDAELEAHNVDRFRVVRTKDAGEAERREAQLVRRYADWLIARGGQVSQRLITPPGRMVPLRTDLFDVAGNEIVEAKGSTNRSSIREALGQILDYSQYVPDARRAVLFPTRPPHDMVHLLTALEVSCIYEAGHEFERDDAMSNVCDRCPLGRRSES
jgi:hypothetical protein